MRVQSFDTNPEAERFQISLIRRASIADRVARTRSLSQTVIQLSRQAILKAKPGLSEEELNLLFLEYHYGAEQAARLRKYLNQRYS